MDSDLLNTLTAADEAPIDDPVMDEPDPIESRGIYVDFQSSDYQLAKTPDGRPGIRIFNDDRDDGDSLIFLELRPNASGTFGRGFAQDIYTFRENVNSTTGSLILQNGGDLGNLGAYTYVAPITSAPDLTSGFQSAVVLIQDNEREMPTARNPIPIRRTQNLPPGVTTRSLVNDSDNLVEFLSDNDDDTLLAGGGNDTIRSGGGNDIVFGESGNDSIDGGTGNDFLFGNQGSDSLFGGEGNDWLDGGTGNDQMEGGNGSDTFVVDSLGDRILDAPGTGTETVRAFLSWELQAGLDHLTLLGNAVSGIGNGFNNYIRGNDFANRLEGRGGDDTLLGDDPEIYASTFAPGSSAYARLISYEDVSRYLDDIIDLQNSSAEPFGAPNRLPGQGNDTIFGGEGNDLILGMFGDDGLYGETGNDQLYGGLGADSLYGGLDNDSLYGGVGNDSLYGGEGSDLLDGGDGANLLEGGSGNDIYVIRNVLDRIVDSPGTGIETVVSYISFDLELYSMAVGTPRVGTTGLDNLTLLDGIAGYGNSLPNVLVGNQSGNILDGRGGNDTLVATWGTDTLIGGGGADRFRFNQTPTSFSAYNTTIQDFNAAEGDVIEVEISRGGFGANPTLSQFRFTSLGTNTGNLFFDGAGGSQLLATIQSNAPFSLNQSLRFI
jgi:Ca2+-binding RTX toxin-like protein